MQSHCREEARYVRGAEWRSVVVESRQRRRLPKHGRRTDSALAEFSHAAVAGRLAEFAAIRVCDERMVKNQWRLRAAEEARESELPPG